MKEIRLKAKNFSFSTERLGKNWNSDDFDEIFFLRFQTRQNAL